MTLRQGKSLACKVILLDDQVPEFNVSVSETILFTKNVGGCGDKVDIIFIHIHRNVAV